MADKPNALSYAVTINDFSPDIRRNFVERIIVREYNRDNLKANILEINKAIDEGVIFLGEADIFDDCYDGDSGYEQEENEE